eukprot:SAG31_NODE_34746_length_329_cov_4.808696_1_plen_31_part_10
MVPPPDYYAILPPLGWQNCIRHLGGTIFPRD